MKFKLRLPAFSVFYIFICVTILSHASPSGIAAVTMQETIQRTEALQSQNPNLLSVFSVSDKMKIPIVRFGKILNRPQPAVLLLEGIHGDESTNTILRLTEAMPKLMSHEGPIKDYFTRGGLIYIAPRINSNIYSRNNKNGVDLNRQFLFFDSKDYYSSQEEVTGLLKWMENEIRSQQIHLQVVFDYHCCDKALSYPWAVRNQDPPANDLAIFKYIGQLFKNRFGNQYAFTRSHSQKRTGDLFPEQNIIGASDDYFYSKYGAYAFTFEGAENVEDRNYNQHVSFLSDVLSFMKTIPVRSWNGITAHEMPVLKTEIVSDFINEKNGVPLQMQPANTPINVSFSSECRQSTEGIPQRIFYLKALATSSEKLFIGQMVDRDNLFPPFTDVNSSQSVTTGFLDSFSSKSDQYRIRGILRSPEVLYRLLFPNLTGKNSYHSMDSLSDGMQISKEFAYGDSIDKNLVFLVHGKSTVHLSILRKKIDQCDFQLSQQFSFDISNFKLLEQTLKLKDRSGSIPIANLPLNERPSNYETAIKGSKSFEDSCTGVAVSNDGYILTAKHCLCAELINHHLSQELATANGARWCQNSNQIPNAPIREGKWGDGVITPRLKGISDTQPTVVAVGKRAYITWENSENFFANNSEMVLLDDDWAILKYKVSEPINCVRVSKKDPKVGDSVWAIGVPGYVENEKNIDRSFYVSRGRAITSRTQLQAFAPFFLKSPRHVLGSEDPKRQFLSTTILLPGYSGSGLFNDQGELLAINTSTLELKNKIDLGAGSTRIDYIQKEVDRLLGAQRTQEIFNCSNP